MNAIKFSTAILKAGVIFLIVLGLSGCAKDYPPLEGGPAPAIVSPDYIVGAGDSVNIFVWRNPELSTGVTVRPDGKITTPLIEDVPASGKTPTQLARDMEKELEVYVRNPVVTVMVNETFVEGAPEVGSAVFSTSIPAL